MIHIIRLDYNNNGILSRKAQVLVKKLGWSISDKPDPNAIINYAFPYLDYRNNTEYPFAAYFTHKETCIQGKVRIWERQAENAILRITSAQQYYDDLCKYGTTVKILPPLDREKFNPGFTSTLHKRQKPLLGLSGFIYAGGRKGEHLIKNILKENLVENVEWTASGEGWPVKTKLWDYDKLQEFFQNIDFYVCTALIEGVPYPPLEALSCGTPIVIPEGVGLLDELPDIPGITRYKKGDYKDLARAINEAKEIKSNKEQLRAVTEIFNEETWARQHEEVFEMFKFHKPEIRKLKSDKGIYIVAIGINARLCADRLIKSIRKFMPNIPVAVLSDSEFPPADITIIKKDIDQMGRKAKTLIHRYAPAEWKYILYLDADTELINKADMLFQQLEAGWDMVFTKDVTDRHILPRQYRKKLKKEYRETLNLIREPHVLAIAGGVFAFHRNEDTEKFFDIWYEEWSKSLYKDQLPLLRAHYKSPCKTLFVGNEYNMFTAYKNDDKTTRILHYSGGQARARVIHYNGKLIEIPDPADRNGKTETKALVIRTFKSTQGRISKNTLIKTSERYAEQLYQAGIVKKIM